MKSYMEKKDLHCPMVLTENIARTNTVKQSRINFQKFIVINLPKLPTPAYYIGRRVCTAKVVRGIGSDYATILVTLHKRQSECTVPKR